MDWFERITGFREWGYQETRDRLRIENGNLLNERDRTGHPVGVLELPSLAELRERVTPLPDGDPLRLGVVVGDVRRLHADPENAGATFQVASQFNMLEMVGPDVTPEDGVTRYAYDRTQGPACAIAAGAGTIWRNYLAPVRDQIGQTRTCQLDGIAELEAELGRQIGAEGRLWEMRNGYALPDRGRLAAIEEHLAGLDEAGLDKLRSLLRVGFHRQVGVTEPGAAPGTRVTQVYASALPVAYSRIPRAEWARLASLVLEAAYEATLLAARLTAASGGTNRLLLTRLGGGAFGNEDRWISNALLRALRLQRRSGLDVLMVSYGQPDAAIRGVKTDWAAQPE